MKATTPKQYSPSVHRLHFDEDLIARVSKEGNQIAINEMQSANQRVGTRIQNGCCGAPWIHEVITKWTDEEAEKALANGQPLAAAALSAIDAERREEYSGGIPFTLNDISATLEYLNNRINNSLADADSGPDAGCTYPSAISSNDTPSSD